MADIKVMSAGAVEPMVRQLGPAFETESGHRLDLFDPEAVDEDAVSACRVHDRVLVVACERSMQKQTPLSRQRCMVSRQKVLPVMSPIILASTALKH